MKLWSYFGVNLDPLQAQTRSKAAARRPFKQTPRNRLRRAAGGATSQRLVAFEPSKSAQADLEPRLSAPQGSQYL